MLLAAGRAARRGARACPGSPRRRRRPRARARRSGRARSKHSSQPISGPAGPSSRASAIVRSALGHGRPPLSPSRGEPAPPGPAELRAARRAGSCRARRGSCRAARRARRSARSFERERDEHPALVRRQRLVDRVPQRHRAAPPAPAPRPGRVPLSAMHGPALGSRGTSRPCQARRRSFTRRLEQRELVGPGREAALAAEVVEACRASPSARRRPPACAMSSSSSPRTCGERRAAAADLEAGGAQQQRVEPRDRLARASAPSPRSAASHASDWARGGASRSSSSRSIAQRA